MYNGVSLPYTSCMQHGGSDFASLNDTKVLHEEFDCSTHGIRDIIGIKFDSIEFNHYFNSISKRSLNKKKKKKCESKNVNVN
jgi:hypothetical protein